MLAFGGTPILTDGLREPDADNPLGYFEWDDAKRLPANPGLISAAAGKAHTSGLLSSGSMAPLESTSSTATTSRDSSR